MTATSFGASSLQSQAITAATRIRWTQVGPTLLVVWIISMFDKANMSIIQINPDFLQEMGLVGQQAKIGLLSTGLFLAYGICAPIWGWMIPVIGARRTAALSLLVWAVTCFWSGMAESYGSLLWSRIVLGFGEAALYPVTLALVANWFALKERGRATAFWWIGTMIGPMLMGLVIPFLIITLGWRHQFHALGIMAFILPIPMIWFLVRDKPALHPRANAAEAELVAAGSLAKNEDAPGRLAKENTSVWTNKRFWLVTAATSLNGINYWGWSIWLPTYLRTVRGFSFATSGYLTFVIFGFAVLTILVVGYVSDRIFRRAPLAAGGWLCAAVFLMMSAYAPTPLLSVVFSICSLCAQQVGISSAEMLMHSVVGEEDMGHTQGVRSFVTLNVSALSPFMMGYILQSSGNNFTFAFAVLAVAVILAAACMIKLAREGY